MGEPASLTPQFQMNANQLWQTVLGDLRTALSRTAFDNWLRDTRLIAFDEDVATIAAQSSIVVATLESRFATRVASALSDAVGRQIAVRFTVLMQSSVEEDAMNRETAALLGVAAATAVLPPPGRQPRPDPRRIGVQGSGRTRDYARVPPPRQIELAAQSSHGLNPRYVYDNYVVGSSNRFAHAASLSVAEHPGGKYNPFFVHGGVGLGKTHLLHAVGHRALELRPNLLISYVTSEKFTNDLIAAIRQQRMEEFRGRYREIDLLMIDDIQFIAGKESTQEEFFHTFNALYQSGKQVLITSDRPPKAISALEDRLRSRFEGGLIADVQLPDYEMRTAILRTKGEELNVLLPADVVEYIAQKDQSNIRELEGGLNKVIARAQLADQPISLSLAMEALTDAAIGARRAKLPAGGVVLAVGRHFGVEVDAIAGRGRSKEIVLPRQVAMYLLREETDASLLEIGRTLGGRDHTTVLHGIRQIERALTTDVGLRSQIMAIREALFTSSAT